MRAACFKGRAAGTFFLRIPLPAFVALVWAGLSLFSFRGDDTVIWSTGDGRFSSSVLPRGAAVCRRLTGDGPVIARTGARFPSSTLAVSADRGVVRGVRALFPGDTTSITGVAPSILPIFCPDLRTRARCSGSSLMSVGERGVVAALRPIVPAVLLSILD